MKLFTHSNLKIQSLFKNKIINTIASYEGKNLSDIDKKLLRGLNSKYIEDPDEKKDKMMSGIKEYMLKKLEEKKE